MSELGGALTVNIDCVCYVDSPGALFNEVITRRSEMDMQVKMREDPLYAIR